MYTQKKEYPYNIQIIKKIGHVAQDKRFPDGEGTVNYAQIKHYNYRAGKKINKGDFLIWQKINKQLIIKQFLNMMLI